MTAAVGGYTGCMAETGEDGLLWMSSYGNGGPGLIGVNRQTLGVEAMWNTPDAYGVSIDFYGYVWTVNGSGAHRVDPESGEVTSYNGLYGAYTYSDMTGYALTYAGGGGPTG